MKHLGDITKINGAEIEPVDVITGGSPCQDLSVAGKRAGLDGERSGLFMEQTRIIKEMRAEDAKRGRTNHACRPRFMVWENVPGALSSNGGEDFRVVLEETARIADKDAVIPRPDGGKWSNAGAIMGNGWSIAWRIHDAQFWGVSQRRRRIALVADFGGQCAAEVLFIRKGLHGDFEASGTARQAIAGDATESARSPGKIINRYDDLKFSQWADLYNFNLCGHVAPTLNASSGSSPTHSGPSVFQSGIAGDANNIILDDQGGKQITVRNDGISPTLMAETHGNIPSVIKDKPIIVFEPGKAKRLGQNIFENVSGTLRANAGDNQHAVAFAVENQPSDNSNTVFETYCIGNGQLHDALSINKEICKTLNCMDDPMKIMTMNWDGGMSLNYQNVCRQGTVVRRLMPVECERLQGFPDGWTDIGEWTDTKGKVHKESSDSARYKALGNSIALPFWFWLLRRIAAQYERPATLGSLFDGIGGFPLCWERCNGKGTARWASEIEEFPIAVTKRHFPEVEEE